MRTRRYHLILIVSFILFTLIFSSSVMAGDNWTHFRQGQKYLKMKRYDVAEDGFRYYLRNSHLHARMAGVAHFGLALMYEDMGQMERAIAEYNLAIQNDRHPDVSVADKSYMNLGAIFMRRKDYDGAIHAYSKVIEENKTHGLAHYYLGMAYLKTGQYDLAHKESEQAQKLGVSLTALSERLAKIYKGKPGSATEEE